MSASGTYGDVRACAGIVGTVDEVLDDQQMRDSGALVPLTFVTTVVANVRVDVDVPEGLFE